MVLQCDVASHQNALSFSTRDELANQRGAEKPVWLDDFLKKTFFGKCKEHPLRKNDLNKYCIDCDKPACQFCASSATHQHHKMFKVYRHIYKDVVSLSTMDKYIDCSQIQPYKSNSRLVISLNPLPHCRATTDNGFSCYICSRKLVDHDIYRYCSISCKVRADSPEPKGSVPIVISDENPPVVDDEKAPVIDVENLNPPEANEEAKEEAKEEPKPVSYRKRKRKGIPVRAPFF